jgi:hypothetical protein
MGCRCVFLRPALFFKLYPSARSKPMWVIQVHATQRTVGADTPKHETSSREST